MQSQRGTLTTNGRPRRATLPSPQYRGPLRIAPPVSPAPVARFTRPDFRLSPRSRRPQSRESCLHVFGYVASILLNLDSLCPRLHCTNLTFGHCRAARRSGWSPWTATTRRRYKPIPTHICRPLKPHFPDFRVIHRSYARLYPFRGSAGNAATPSSRGRTSPPKPLPRMAQPCTRHAKNPEPSIIHAQPKMLSKAPRACGHVGPMSNMGAQHHPHAGSSFRPSSQPYLNGFSIGLKASVRQVHSKVQLAAQDPRVAATGAARSYGRISGRAPNVSIPCKRTAHGGI